MEGLRGHPDVFVTTPKEPDYFAYPGQRLSFRGPGDDLAVNHPSVTDRADYLALYPHNPGPEALGEGSVSTLYHYERVDPRDPSGRARCVGSSSCCASRSSARTRAFDYLSVPRPQRPPRRLLAAVADEDRPADRQGRHLWHYTRG